MEDDLTQGLYSVDLSISIHVLRMEDDNYTQEPTASRCTFQSTSSAWRTTYYICPIINRIKFQSTSSAWRTTVIIVPKAFALNISIHVLRMEDDQNINAQQ